MKSTTTKYVGVDVCKSKLDVNSLNLSVSINNQTPEIDELIQRLIHDDPECHFVCEATGGYERNLVAACHAAGVPVSVINAKKVRDFANAMGQLAKTDKIDAGVIREFGRVFEPIRDLAPSKEQSELSAAVRRKDKLTRDLVREKNAKEKVTDRFVKNDIEVTIRHLERRIKGCEAHIQKIISANENFAEKKQKMEQIRGVGPVLSAVLLAEMPELGTISDKKAARLVGVAPLNRDSGKYRGTRSIHGGRSLVRRNLYMPALTATSHNPILKAFYQRLKDKNKAHHVALAAVMRKLICLINRILGDPNFTPTN